MASEKKKINRVISFLKKGLTSLSDELSDTVKNINDFVESLQKAEKDLKGISISETVQTVSTSSTQVVSSGGAKATAANTLFNLLAGRSTSPAPATASTAASSGPPRAPSGPPKVMKGPPKAPVTAPPRAPSGPPKAPVTALPKAPVAALPKAPSGPPRAPSGPPKAPVAAPPPAAPSTSSVEGGGLSSLRDEMLGELDRLKKIMRGE